MKLFIAFICMVLLLSGCNAQKLPEDSGSLLENESSLSQAESELSSQPESSSSPEESSLSSQGEASSSGVEPEESGLFSEADSAAAELDLEEEIAGFERNYYEVMDPGLFDDAFYEANHILHGGKIDCSKIVQCYESIYNLAVEEDFDEFVAAYKQGTPLSKLIQATNSYYTTVSGEWDVIPGTAEMEKVGNDFIVGTVYETDNGSMFCFPENNELYSELCTRYDSDHTYATFTIFYGVGCTIVLSDGEQESVIFMDTIPELQLKANVLNSADQAMEKIIAARDSIVQPQYEPEVNSDGEINAVTG